MEDKKIIIDKWLENYFNEKIKEDNGFNKLYEAMAYSINIGGKRIRPILFMTAFKTFSNEEAPINVACAIEMIHTYSLIHDDLPCMDNDDLRRGKPTNHKVFGEDLATLAGDGLLNEAMDLLFEFLSDNTEFTEAVKYISNAAGTSGMIGGQVVDMLNENKSVDMNTLINMHRRKTGALIKASLVSGARIANASRTDIATIEEFGETLGLAFQVIDDILDVVGDEAKLGKKIGSDKENDKTTFVKLLGIEKSRAYARELTKKCLTLLGEIEGDTSDLEKITDYLLNREE